MTYCDHAKDQLFERAIARYGVSESDVTKLIRLPNRKDRDRRDPHPSGIRQQRWFNVPIPAGGARRFRAVFIVTEPRTDERPGSIEVITVIDEEAV